MPSIGPRRPLPEVSSFFGLPYAPQSLLGSAGPPGHSGLWDTGGLSSLFCGFWASPQLNIFPSFKQLNVDATITFHSRFLFKITNATKGLLIQGDV